MRAFLKNYRQAPRKVRLIANVAVGKRVDIALSELSFLPNKASKALYDLVRSALANAVQENSQIVAEDLFVKSITVDKGITYVRYMPRAFGRASPINRECSHVRVTLEARQEKKPQIKKNNKDSSKKKDAVENESAQKTPNKKEIEKNAEVKKTTKKKSTLKSKK